ncbi:choice-of-anchor I family protein [Corynebacterium incognita]|uniref:Choice-of-anchor I family protein n=1 Tax=Corynebacterium incognita TaxID=2754725 RepID=A0A7G7CQG9_9CORY|nr:choice-of-anchor I family protein [Corynebacterium incognita]QNE89835.1 choice-of-anchor I family protein [Corynebacterium incognita]
MRIRNRALALCVAASTAAVGLAPVATAQEGDFNGIVANPIIHSAPDASLEMKPVGVHMSGIFGDDSAAEIVAFHADSKRILTVNAANGRIDIIDATDPANLKPAGTIEAGGDQEINSVAVREDGLAVAAVQQDDKTAAGEALFFNAATGEELGRVTVGSLPDMVTITEDGKYALIANEGEPANELDAATKDYTVDPEGSVAVIALPDDVAAASQADTKIADFKAFDAPGALPEGVRVFGPEGSKNLPSQDFEPEYIATRDGKAYATLQENNAIAVIDIASATVEKILPAHVIDHNEVPLDPSNKDDKAELRTAPVKGLSMPDSIAAYEANGSTYLVTANEGDAREWGDEDSEAGIYAEEINLGDMGEDGVAPLCEDLAATIEKDGLDDKTALGKLKLTRASGLSEDGSCYEELYSFGGRGFTIYDAEGNVVFNSGAELEQITKELADGGKLNFNASNDSNETDDRSDNKGPEPEALTVGQVGDRTYAFVGAERVGGVFVYDITDPAAAKFVTYVNNRDFSQEVEDVDYEQAKHAGDLGPEGLKFIHKDDSPNGEYLLVAGNEVSGTTTVFEITNLLPEPADDSSDGSSGSSGSSDSSDGSSSSNGGSSVGGFFAMLLAVVGLAAGVGAVANMNPDFLKPYLAMLPKDIRKQVEERLF